MSIWRRYIACHIAFYTLLYPYAKQFFSQNTRKHGRIERVVQKNQLVYYTPLEEFINSSSHALGAVFALIFMIFMMIAATTPAQYVTAFFSCFLIAIEFAVSATYHGVSDMKKKLVWRKIDFPTVNLNVIACATSTCLLYRQIYGYVALGVSIAIAIAVFALCLWKFNVFRNASVISSFVIGALMLAAFFTAYFSPIGISTPTCFVFLAGLVSCLLGAAVFGVHKRYVHCIFHFFVLAGPVLFLIATYLQILGK